MIDGICPHCKATVEFKAFCDAFPCPHCGEALESWHECYYHKGDSYCADWLTPAGCANPDTYLWGPA